MNIQQLHAWDLSPKEAIIKQKKLAQSINLTKLQSINYFTTVAGVDVSMNYGSNFFTAAVVVLNIDTLEVIESVATQMTVEFPYIPGLLSFREIPILVRALEEVKSKVDIICVDGHGQAHPRRLGIASHLGLLVNVPTIGIAKNILVGQSGIPGEQAKSMAEIYDKEDHIGYVVRTKSKVKPVYISAGNNIDHLSAAQLGLKCTKGYRLPEPTRLAHLYANKIRKETI